jgi:hypothetical protein
VELLLHGAGVRQDVKGVSEGLHAKMSALARRKMSALVKFY